jgi:hypothetical protein
MPNDVLAYKSIICATANDIIMVYAPGAGHGNITGLGTGQQLPLACTSQELSSP